jgi:DNA-binding GntR family transcriptional regulator
MSFMRRIKDGPFRDGMPIDFKELRASVKMSERATLEAIAELERDGFLVNLTPERPIGVTARKCPECTTTRTLPELRRIAKSGRLTLAFLGSPEAVAATMPDSLADEDRAQLGERRKPSHLDPVAGGA